MRSHLRDAKGNGAGVLLEAELEVEEDALGRLRSQVPGQVADRADGGREHEVECHRFGEVILGDRRLNLLGIGVTQLDAQISESIPAQQAQQAQQAQAVGDRGAAQVYV